MSREQFVDIKQGLLAEMNKPLLEGGKFLQLSQSLEILFKGIDLSATEEDSAYYLVLGSLIAALQYAHRLNGFGGGNVGNEIAGAQNAMKNTRDFIQKTQSLPQIYQELVNLHNTVAENINKVQPMRYSFDIPVLQAASL